MKLISEVSKEEVNRELAERLGLCWHEWKEHPQPFLHKICRKCGHLARTIEDRNPDFFSDSDKIQLLREMKKSDYWNRFYIWASVYARIMDYSSSGVVFIAVDCLLDDTYLMERVLEWLRKEQG